MRILITGAAGFLGSHLCDRFLELGHEVIGVEVDDFLRSTVEERIDPVLARAHTHAPAALEAARRRRISRKHDRYAERVEFAFVDDASHFIPEDAPDAVAALALDWFRRGDQAASESAS